MCPIFSTLLLIYKIIYFGLNVQSEIQFLSGPSIMLSAMWCMISAKALWSSLSFVFVNDAEKWIPEPKIRKIRLKRLAVLKEAHEWMTNLSLMNNDCLKTAWGLSADCLKTAWRLPEDCLRTAWGLPEDWQKTAWGLPEDCLTAAWCTKGC